jgi:carbon monoxide dehydrogenase subunit G
MAVNMKLASEFSVPAAPDKVFPLFFDPETMRGCIPGCERLVREDEKTYRGTLVNEIAHVRFSAGFAADIRSVTDEADGKSVTAVLTGEDRRLGSSIKIDARLSVRPDGDDSVIGYEMDLALWGKLGRLGEPIIRRRSREVELEFAKALATACGAPVEKVAELDRAAAKAAGPRAESLRRLVTGPAATTEQAREPGVELAVATQRLALVATAVSLVALVVAAFGRGR